MTPRDDYLHDCGAALDRYLAASAPAPTPTPPAGTILFDAPLTARQVSIHVQASSGSDGVLTLESRTSGGSWFGEVLHLGPTLQRGNGATLNYPLYGLYRGASAFTSQLRVGHIRHATTRALAEAIFA